jgi:CBS domain-containing protein
MADESLSDQPGYEPAQLCREIEQADSIEGLRLVSAKIHQLAQAALRQKIQIKSVVRLISGFNDAIVLRLIHLLGRLEGIELPPGAAYLVLGSEARGEQTLRTDQDNAIVYRDDLPAAQLLEVKQFAGRLVEALVQIGVPRCPGNIMANSPQWCHGLSEWKTLVDRWVTAPTPEHVLCFGMIQDLRPLHGDTDLGMRLREHIIAAVWRHPNFFANMAGHVVRFPPPFTIFRRIRVEHRGEHRGKVDLKKAGLFAITKGVSLLVLESGSSGGNTWENLKYLEKLGIFSRKDLQKVEQAFSFMIELRLQRQILELSQCGKATNHIDPRAISEQERDQLRQALQGVTTFLWMLRHHYNLDYRAR